ncbi:MAG: pseudaminic acid biosynthesis-associated methylase [Piscinibacter sp.]|uniref:pseudaminic acid biosynthesis-associated methylase n=1 Tax=Piscinibacter sp. TaxID=1903157 RepID=UPI003D0E6917
MPYNTEQEGFWAGQFGTDYIARNESKALLAANVGLFARALRGAGTISSCVEFGANIGMNLRALRVLYPEISLRGIEINRDAAAELAKLLGDERVYCGSMFDFQPAEPADLTLSKGVLIHINPDMLPAAYSKLYQASRRWILICEYYNPSPVAIPYRGHSDRLFKRDFAGEMLEAYPGLALVDYGFAYRRDPVFPQDDISWFLLRK